MRLYGFLVMRNRLPAGDLSPRERSHSRARGCCASCRRVARVGEAAQIATMAAAEFAQSGDEAGSEYATNTLMCPIANTFRGESMPGDGRHRIPSWNGRFTSRRTSAACSRGRGRRRAAVDHPGSSCPSRGVGSCRETVAFAVMASGAAMAFRPARAGSDCRAPAQVAVASRETAAFLGRAGEI